MLIRRAEPSDAKRMLEIYAPFVLETAVSFETAVPDVDDFSNRISATLKGHEWLVAEVDDNICGYAYGSTHRVRSAYRSSVETSVYVDPVYQGRGVGRKLYTGLFDSLQTLGFHYAYAGIALPNVASIALHKAVGFESIGVFKEVGFKNGNWHDVSWWQRPVSCQST